ncbi:MAG: sulfur carrier protein ThiS adenylyltransferase ThiF [Lachnospiraceae bacterium]|nr:sulfur carrier protein ThiS adenylyltransferase ThiF [Lachnospiraceae bacterium]
MIPTKEEFTKALASKHGKALQEKLGKATVAVCGAGGLGSNISIALARTGIGKLIIIDFDKVEITNLNRQQYKVSQLGEYKAEALASNLKEIAPYVEVETHNILITAENAVELLESADIICEAFDKAENKAMLTNVVLEQLPEKYYVAGSGMAGLDSANNIKTRKLTEKFFLCGDTVSDIATEESLVAPRVLLCAAHQAHTVVRIIAGES